MRKSNLTYSIVHELVDYDPLTGLFVWKERSLKWFDSFRSQCSWNAKWAGKRAFASKRKYPPKTTYLCGCLNYENHFGHRIAFLWMTGRWPIEVDHKNGDGTNNRWVNLREVTRTENQQNRRANSCYAGKKPRFKHAGIKQQGKSFGARIKVNGKPVWLGTFKTLNEAVAVRRDAQLKFGFTERHGMRS